MVLRGSGTEFHDTTISVDGTDQRTFGQDVDSEYDVQTTAETTPTTVTTTDQVNAKSRRPKGAGGRFIASYELSSNGTVEQISYDVTFEFSLGSNQSAQDVIGKVRVGGDVLDKNTSFIGENDTNTMSFSRTVSGSPKIGFESNTSYDHDPNVEVSGTIDVKQSVQKSVTVDGVSKTK